LRRPGGGVPFRRPARAVPLALAACHFAVRRRALGPVGCSWCPSALR